MKYHIDWLATTSCFQVILEDQDGQRTELAPIILEDTEIKTRRGAIGHRWWTRHIIEELENQAGSHVQARKLARGSGVLFAQVNPGLVVGIVNNDTYYYNYRLHGISPEHRQVPTLRFPWMTDGQWATIAEDLRDNPLYLAQILGGDLDAEFRDALVDNKVWLSATDISATCTCSDARWSQCCQHALALAYVLAERLDQQPELLFTLRGRNLDDVVRTIYGVDAPLVESEATSFWTAPRPLPSLDEPPLSAYHIPMHELPQRLQDQLRDVYKRVGQHARQWWQQMDE